MAYEELDEIVLAELVTIDWLNQIVENFRALKNPNVVVGGSTSGYTTSSTSFVDVDATDGKFSLTITTTGGDVEITALLTMNTANSAPNVGLDVYESVSAARLSGQANGMLGLTIDSTSQIRNVTLRWLHHNVPAGTHTYKLQWKVNAQTASIMANYPQQFVVREVN